MEQEQAPRLGQGAGHLNGPDAELPPGQGTGPAAAATSPLAALGPWLLLFPLVFLALAVVWLAGRRGSPPHAPRAPQELAGTVDGWSGSQEIFAGRLVARLAPLHASPERQAFEGRTLGARLGLGEGEPFKLSLSWITPETVGAGELDLERLSVQDGRGRRLAPLAPDQLRPGEPADPLRTLLSPPVEGLPPGRSVHLLLWGRAPGSGARVRGLARAGVEPASLEIPLAQGTLGGADADAIFARGALPERPRRSAGLPRPVEPEPNLDPGAGAGEDLPPDDVPRPAPRVDRDPPAHEEGGR